MVLAASCSIAREISFWSVSRNALDIGGVLIWIKFLFFSRCRLQESDKAGVDGGFWSGSVTGEGGFFLVGSVESSFAIVLAWALR